MKPGQCACRRSLKHNALHLLMGLGLIQADGDYWASVYRFPPARCFWAVPWREWPRRLHRDIAAESWRKRRPFTAAWLRFTFWPT